MYKYKWIFLLLLFVFSLSSFRLVAQDEESLSDEADSVSAVNNENYLKNPGRYLMYLDSTKIPTGILIDRVKFRKDLKDFNGKSRVKTSNFYIWKRLYNNLKFANNDTAWLPPYSIIRDYLVDIGRYEKIYKIPILNMQFNALKKEAIENNDFVEKDSFLISVNANLHSFRTTRLLAANTFATRIHGDITTFELDSGLYFSNITGEHLKKIEANFDDGTGWHVLNWNEPISIHYGADSRWILAKIRITISKEDPTAKVKGGIKEIEKHLYTHFTFLHTGSSQIPEQVIKNKLKISEPISTSPNPTILHFPAENTIIEEKMTCWYTFYVPKTITFPDMSYKNCRTCKISEHGQKLDYNILFGSGNISEKLRKPIVVVDGFDPGNMRDYYETVVPEPAGDDPKSNDYRGLYELMNGVKSAWSKDPGANMVGDLINAGYDVIFINWTNGDGDIPTNAGYLRQFLNEVLNSPKYRDNQTEEIIMVGPSMGGIITRYCLTSMEQANPAEEHHVKLWFSFDSPQKGAYIPVGLQYSLLFLRNRVAEVDDGVLSSFTHEAKLKLDSKLSTLNSIAAKQMLLVQLNGMGNDEGAIMNNYNYFSGSYHSLFPDVLKVYLYDIHFPPPLPLKSLDQLGYPKYSKNIAISNGGVNLLYPDDKKTIFQFKIQAYISSWSWNAFKLETAGSSIFFNAIKDIMEPVVLCGSSTLGYENAPGGYNTALYDFNQNEDNANKPSSDVDAYPQYAKATFMPTVSAFGITPTQENIHKTWNQIDLSETPFDYIKGTSNGDNEEHCRVSYNTSIWLQNDILKNERKVIQKPFPRSTGYIESESKACMYAATQTATFGGVSNSEFVIKSGADVKIAAGTSIIFKAGFKVEKGAKLSAKCGTVPNGALKSAYIPSEKKVMNYIDPSPYAALVANYSIDTVKYFSDASKLPSQIQVYPNPALDKLYIYASGVKNDSLKFSVMDIYGKILITSRFDNTNAINISILPAGIYFVKVCNNNLSENFKIIKE